jgi:hypothetical protein
MLHLILLTLCLAEAGELLPGIPVEGVADLGTADFLTPDLGWTAPIPGGFVRVFVGRSDEEAQAWVQASQMSITQPLPAIAGLGSEAYGDETGLVIVRNQNIALQVRSSGAARAVAESMLAAVPVDGAPWPSPPSLVEGEDGRWQVSAPGAVRVTFSGGRVVPGAASLTFSQPPTELTAWDRLGRSATWTAAY